MIHINYREFVKQIKQAAKIVDPKREDYANVLVHTKPNGTYIYASNEFILWSSFCPSSGDKEVKFFVKPEQVKALRVPKRMEDVVVHIGEDTVRLSFEEFDVTCPLAKKHLPFKMVIEAANKNDYSYEITVDAKLLRKALGGLNKVTFKFPQGGNDKPIILEDDELNSYNIIAPYRTF